MKQTQLTALSLLALAQVGLAAVPNLLLFSRTVGYRHESIPVAAAAIQNISTSTGAFNLTWSEDETLFTPSTLSTYSIIAFLSNSDQVLTASGEVALQGWLAGGGSLIGFHAATACLFNDTSFAVGIGALFSDHPTIGNSTYDRVLSHPTTDMLPNPYTTYEEAYRFRSDPRSVGATVLYSLDEASAPDSAYASSGYWQGTPAPSIWLRDGAVTPVDLNNATSAAESSSVMRGRTWYTSLGHTNDTWRNPVHLAHVQAGIEWVIEGLSVNSTATASSSTSTTAPTSSTSKGSTNSATSSSATSAVAAATSAPPSSGAASYHPLAGPVLVAMAAAALGAVMIA